MSDEVPQRGEAWLPFFRRKRKISEVILLAWSIIEFEVDQLVTRQFGLFYTDKKAKILMDQSFNKKLEFLKDQNIFSKEDFQVLKEFQEFRNKLFHGDEPFWFNLPDSEKDKIMDNAVKGSQITRKTLIG